MAVRLRIKAEPINRLMVIGTACLTASYLFFQHPTSWWGADLLAGVSGVVGGAAIISAAGKLMRDYRLRRNLAQSMAVSQDHGSAREATADEIAARGMYDAASGDLLGLERYGYPVFAPKRTPFGLYEMPPGVGKTVCYVIPSILHRVMAGSSIVIPDPKLDLAVMLLPQLRKRGVEVWAVNPTGQFLAICGDTAINPYQPVIAAVHASGEARKNAVKYAGDYAELHYPTQKDDKNLYFSNGSRRVLMVSILMCALLDPGRCTPTHVYALIADPARFLKQLREVLVGLETLIPDDPVVAFLKTEARNLLHRAEKNEENFASFLEGATQRLLPFNQAGHLGGYGTTAFHYISTLRERQIVLFIMAPLSHGRAFADFISLLNYNIIEACKTKPAGHPVHIVGEEALNYQFKDLVSNLETMRQLNVSADFFIQSFAGLVERYGREKAQAIESYCDVRVYAGLNSYERAKHVSDMLSEGTIRRQDYSYKHEVSELNLSSREMGRRLMQPNEIIAMPRDQAWVFVRGMHPMRLTMVHYGQVSPWRDQVDPSPISGTKLYDKPLFTIRYAEEEQ